jgi:hypothetical protein
LLFIVYKQTKKELKIIPIYYEYCFLSLFRRFVRTFINILNFTGIGCIFPFLPVHMLHVGLDRGEARLISAVAPCVAILGPAVLGVLIDK